jgi:hypothetical protein
MDSSANKRAELADHIQSVATARQDATQLVQGLTHAQFNWHPAAGRWSLGQCLDHLNRTGEKTIPRLAWGIAEARRQGWFKTGPFRYGRLSRWLVTQVIAENLPPRRRFRAPSLYAPAATCFLEPTIAKFNIVQDQLTALLQKADGVDLERIKVSSPVNRLFKLSLGLWFVLLLGHQHRHLDQAKRVRVHSDFPVD